MSWDTCSVFVHIQSTCRSVCVRVCVWLFARDVKASGESSLQEDV